MSIYSYLISLCVLIVVYVIGHILCACFLPLRDQRQYRIFVKMILGILIPVVLYALYKTEFSSILSGICLLTLLFRLNMRKQHVRFKEMFYALEWSDLGYVLIAFSIVSITNTYAYFYHLNPDVLAINGSADQNFYIKLSEYLNEFGVETSSMVAPYFIPQAPSLYHYYNEWFTALLVFITRMRTDIIFLSIVIPILYTVCLIGIVSLSYKMTNISLTFRWGIAILLLFVSGFTLSASAPGIPILSVGDSSLYWGVGIMHSYISMKLPIIVIFIVLFLLNSECGLTANSFWILSLLIILWPTLIPGILGATVFWILYSYVRCRKCIIKNVYYVFFSVLFVGIFYKMESNTIRTEAVDWSDAYELFKEMIMNGEYFKRMFFEGSSSFAKQIFNYSPYLLVLFFIKWKKQACCININSLFFLLSMVIFSLIASMLFFVYADGFQLFLNMAQPILFVFVSLIVYSVFPVQNICLKVIITLLLLLSVYSTVCFLGTREPFTKNLKLLSFLGDKPLKMAEIKKFPIVADEKMIAFQQVNRVSTTFDISKGVYSVFLSCFEKPPVCQTIEEGINSEKNKIGKSLLYKLNRRWNTPCSLELRLRAILTDLSTLRGQPFYNFVKEKHLENQIDCAKLLFLDKYEFDVLVAPKEDEWLKENRLNLPITSEFSDDRNEYVYYKLNWSRE